MRIINTYIIENNHGKRTFYKNVTKEYIQRVVKSLSKDRDIKWRIVSEMNRMHMDYIDDFMERIKL